VRIASQTVSPDAIKDTIIPVSVSVSASPAVKKVTDVSRNVHALDQTSPEQQRVRLPPFLKNYLERYPNSRRVTGYKIFTIMHMEKYKGFPPKGIWGSLNSAEVCYYNDLARIVNLNVK
jgi:hypothetical protein